MKITISTLSFLFFTLLGCSQTKDFDEMIDKTINKTIPFYYMDSSKCEDCIFLDTRKEEEFEVSHIEGARFISYGKFKIKDVKDIEKDKQIVVYCSIGYRSEKIGEELKKAGYTNVTNLYGGIFEWKNKGGVVVDMEGQETEKVHCYNKNWSQWLENGEKIY